MTPDVPVANLDLDFLAGGGEMGQRIREFDWSGHPLGNPELWPQSLKTSVSLILSSRHPMWIGWGREMSFLYNDAYLHVLGLAKHPWALGRPASDVWAEIWDVCGPLAEKVFKDGQASFVDDVRLFMNRGDFLEETYYSFSYSPIRDETGKVGGLFCPSNDVTPKVLSARRLRTLSELSGNALAEQTSEAACAAAAATLAKNSDDIPFAIVYLANRAGDLAILKEAVRIEPGPWAPNSASLLSGSLELPWPVAEVFETRRPQRVSVAGIEALPRGPAGQAVSEALVLPIVSRAHDQPFGVLIAGLNPTRRSDPDHETFFELMANQVGAAIQNANAVEDERRRADLLAELDRAKTTFFSNVSHEFRTPLTLMLGPLEQVLSQPDSIPPKDREQIETAHRNSLRLLKLVNSLLDFSRLEAGRMRASFVPVDLAKFTGDLASNFRSAMEAAGLELVVDCPPLPKNVYVDREMWEKIVLNLLSNAFKFTFEGSVTVKMEADGGHATLTVSDTGVGIPERELPHIFERFHRAEGTKGRTYEGTGIGLALIQDLVKLHGGAVEVQSHLGRGSAFAVTLPFGSEHLPQDRLAAPDSRSITTRSDSYTAEAMAWLAEDRRAHPTVDTQGSRNRGPRPKVLLADDNADMREHILRTLGDEYEITAVADGSEALKSALRETPDLILSDVMMPETDGFELLRAVRENPRLREVPVILLSARAGEEARTEGINAGADEYLTKPFTARELAVRVANTLHLHRLRREARVQFETLLNQAPLGVYLVDSSLRLRQVNPIARHFFGDIPDLIGRKFDETIHLVWPSAEADEMLERFRHTLETGEPCMEAERLRDFGNGSAKQYFEWRIDRMPLPDGRFGVVCYFRDVSAEVEARHAIERSQQELRRVNQDLEQFAYSASHDLQEPLRSVKIYSELLSMSCRDRLDGEDLEYLEYLRTGATRMEVLVRDLLAYTQASRIEGEAGYEDSRPALEAALANLAGAIAESGANITSDSMPRVRVHAAHLQQLFQNIIGNAVKYRRAGMQPIVHVSAQRQNENWLFSIRDNGIGIEPEFKERIFGLFKRLHPNHEYSGTGIGLALCQRIVENYHGRIWVESEPGAGSAFFFTLPA